MGFAGFGAQVDYYQLLQVQRDATQQQIKRQYYILARRLHPDKNAGDAEASARFQLLAEAYQVLSNPTLRARYDQHGLEGLDLDFMDAAAFYTCLFGSDMFDQLVGELVIATVARSSDGLSPAELQEMQTARVQHLVRGLTSLLLQYVEGDKEGFKAAMHQETARLAGASFGATMLQCVGSVYCSHADIYLGGVLEGTWARVRQGRESFRSHLRIAGAALKVMSHQEKIAAFERQCEAARRRRQQQQRQEQRRRQLPLAKQQQQQPQGSYMSYPLTAHCSPDGTAQLQHWQQFNHSWWQQPQQQQQLQQHVALSSCAGQQAAAGSSSIHSSALDDLQLASSSDHAGQSNWSSSNQVDSRRSVVTVSCGTSPAAAEAAAQQMQRPKGLQQHSDASTANASSSRDADSCYDGCNNQHDADMAAAGLQSADLCDLLGGMLSTEELLQRSQLEDVGLQLCMEAMWAANVVDIQKTLGTVCQAVLYDRAIGRGMKRLRALALRELGTIFCSATGPFLNPKQAKQYVHAAYQAVIAKQMAEGSAGLD
eukprot:GHRR01031345.1.p1 GENE.GHRR01031345.1~~GHRR01031345.1.p1  ORF type:complete len:541 (+),score=254.00 GHRR01031345.1:550-2172(+)